MTTIQHSHRPFRLWWWYVAAAVLTGAVLILMVATLRDATHTGGNTAPQQLPVGIVPSHLHGSGSMDACFAQRHPSSIELQRSGCQ
jgi:hypothetical protein